MAYSTATTVHGIGATVVEECSLAGTTKAACTVSIEGKVQGETTGIDIKTTLTGSDVVYHEVPITAGANKLSKGSCTTSAIGATSTGKGESATGGPTAASGNAAAPTGITQLVKVMVALGAPALLAGAFV